MSILKRLFGSGPKAPTPATGKPSQVSQPPPDDNTLPEGHRFQNVLEKDPAVRVNPSLVKCGFCIYPASMANLMTPARLHQAIETNQNAFWKAVRERQPNIKVMDMMVQSDGDVNDFIHALRAMKLLDGNSVAVGLMQINPDPRTFRELRIGFIWPEESPRIVVVRPNGIVPE